jgi:hypothetical protein
MHSSESRRLRWAPMLEATSVFLLILLYIWRLRFYTPSTWIAILAVILISHACRKETPVALGFRSQNLVRSLAKFSPVLLFLTLVLLTLGILFRTVRGVTWESAFFSLAFYCLWGLFQQYVLNGYFVNRFVEFFRPGESNRAPILAAIFFAAVHSPNWFLMLITLAGGYVCAKAYLNERNLYFLGLAHGLIGFLLYLVVPDSISRHLYVGPKWFSR